MTKKNSFADWQPDQYLKFSDQRTQPADDLAARIETANPARIIDLGCGPGNSTAVLRKRWPAAELIGLDSSAAMLEKARRANPELTWLRRDLAGDLSDLGSFDIIFSNAVLQWISEIAEVIPRLFKQLNPGGVLAFQVPFASELPSHRVMRQLTESPGWSACFGPSVPQPIYRSAADYYRILSGLTSRIALWETRYIQIMPGLDDIVEWNKGSALRPLLDALPDAPLRDQFLAEYREAIHRVYQAEPNCAALYPFTRVFAVAGREA